MRNSLRTLCLLIALVFTLGGVALADASIVTEAGFPVVTEPIKLTVMASMSSVQPDFEEMAIIKAYDAMTGIDAQWMCVPSSARNDRVTLAISSGELPDVFFKCSISANNLQRYGASGDIIDLMPYLEKYAPNFWAYSQANPDVLASVTTPDGKVYSLPAAADAAATRMNKKLYFNQEWMDELGLEQPTTLDELYDVMYEMRNGDPNGNGEKDEVPMSETTNTLFQILGGLFGVGNRGTHSTEYDVDPETGRVRHSKTSDAFREALEFMTKLYAEGIIDQECITCNDSHIVGLAAQDKLGVYFATNLALLGANDAAKFVPATTWVEDAVWATMRSHLHSVGAFVVTSACENPEAALRWVDYFYSDEGVAFYHYGIEGETYTVNEDGSLSYVKEIMDQITGDKSYDEVVSSVSPYCGGNNPTIMSYPGYAGMELGAIPMASAEALLPFTPEVVWPIFTYTPEETEIISTTGSEINTYVRQTCTEFLTGARELNDAEWEAFVSQVESMGVEQVIEVYENASARASAIINAN